MRNSTQSRRDAEARYCTVRGVDRMKNGHHGIDVAPPGATSIADGVSLRLCGSASLFLL